MNKTRQDLFDLYETIMYAHQRVMMKAEEILDIAFEERDEYTIPFWMGDLMKDSCFSIFKTCTNLNIRHKGVWVMILGIRKVNGHYLVSGIECEHDMSGRVEDIEYTNAKDLLKFIFFYRTFRFNEMLYDLRNRILGLRHISDASIVIREWCDKNRFDEKYIDEGDVLKWIGK